MKSHGERRMGRVSSFCAKLVATDARRWREFVRSHPTDAHGQAEGESFLQRGRPTLHGADGATALLIRRF